MLAKSGQINSVSQPDINSLLVEHASQGETGLAFKGRGPVHIRGVVERKSRNSPRLAFRSRSYPVSLQPVVAPPMPVSRSPIGDHAQSCLFVTGHLQDGSVDLDWQQLARPNPDRSGVHGAGWATAYL